MKAAVIHEHGDASRIRVQDVPEPALAPGEVIVQMRAAALNHLDVWVRKGGRAAIKMPHILGSDGAGVVAAVGQGVTGVKVGDEVVINPGLSCSHCRFCQGGEHSLCAEFAIVGMARPGTFAKKIAVPARNVLPKPPHLDFAQAAALPLAHVTAWRMLFTRARLLPGMTVLIHGVGGGVALAGLQLAKLAGATVIVTSSSDEKLAAAAKAGADHAINYKKTPDVAAAVRQLTGGIGVDIALDTVGAATMPISIAAVRRGGAVVNCGVTTGAEATLNLQQIYWNQLSIFGSTLGSGEDFRQILAAVGAAALKPIIDSTFPLDDARRAAERMESAGQFGKIVLMVG